MDRFIRFESSVLVFEKCAPSIQCFAGLWILKNMVIECILSESNAKWFSLFSIDFCFAECVISSDKMASVLHNACLQLKKLVVNNSFNGVQVWFVCH